MSAHCRPRTLTATERATITTGATDLPALWNAPTTTLTDRKDLLRILIQDITVTVIGVSELVDVTICWSGWGSDRLSRSGVWSARFPCGTFWSVDCPQRERAEAGEGGPVDGKDVRGMQEQRGAIPSACGYHSGQRQGSIGVSS